MKETILSKLASSVASFDPDAAASWAQKAVEAGIDPLEALDSLTLAIRQVGDAFERRDAFLPELVGAASAMQAALPPLQAQIQLTGANRESTGIMVIGTVFGDIHTIGKTMVSTLCAAEGFEIVDLGTNVSATEFLDGIRASQADILAMSALMTMTAPHIREVMSLLEDTGLRTKVKVMVGGAGVNEAFSAEVGADGYEPTAPGAAKLARRLMGK